MEKKQPSVETPAPEYPVYMKILWRFVRTAIASGISSALTVQVVLQPDWSNGKTVFLALSSAFVTGAISSGAMALRDYLSHGDYNAPIQKLPL